MLCSCGCHFGVSVVGGHRSNKHVTERLNHYPLGCLGFQGDNNGFVYGGRWHKTYPFITMPTLNQACVNCSEGNEELVDLGLLANRTPSPSVYRWHSEPQRFLVVSYLSCAMPVSGGPPLNDALLLFAGVPGSFSSGNCELPQYPPQTHSSCLCGMKCFFSSS